MFLSCFLFLSFFFFSFFSLWVFFFFGGGGGEEGGVVCMGVVFCCCFFLGGGVWGRGLSWMLYSCSKLVAVVFVVATTLVLLLFVLPLSSLSFLSLLLLLPMVKLMAVAVFKICGTKRAPETNSVVTNKERLCSQAWLSFVGCLTSQQQASVSQGRIC